MWDLQHLPTQLFCDNQAALHIAANNFTKALGKEQFLTLRHKLGVHDLHLPT